MASRDRPRPWHDTTTKLPPSAIYTLYTLSSHPGNATNVVIKVYLKCNHLQAIKTREERAGTGCPGVPAHERWV